MKRKAVEQIQPLKVQKAAGKYKFIAAAVIMKIKDEEYLIVDIFQNLQRKLNKPLLRIALTKKDFGNFDFDGNWDRSNIDNKRYMRTGIFFQKGLTAIDSTSEDTITSFTNQKYGDWTLKIESAEQKIKYAERDRQKNKKQVALQDRINTMPQIPERFYSWCEDELMNRHRYIFYKRKGRFATFTCSTCGETYHHATRRIDTYEGQFEHIVPVPIAGQSAKCEKCGIGAVYKTIGRGNDIEIKESCYIIQKYGTGGAVVRYFDIYKTISPGNPEVLEDVEIARNFFTPGMKKVQKDYQVYSSFSGTQFWIANNTPGLGNIQQGDAPLWPESLRELKETMLQYSAMDIWYRDYRQYKWHNYLEAYWKAPVLEMIVKMGLKYTAEKICFDPSGQSALINSNGTTAAAVLQINKEKIPKLIKEKGNTNFHKLLKLERDLGINLKEEEEDAIVRFDIQIESLKTILDLMSTRQYINRVEKYAGVDLSQDVCSAAEGQIRITAQTYIDYLSMRISMGYDMTNPIYVYPRDLREEHHKMVLETNQREAEQRIGEANAKYPNIAKQYKSLCRQYEYQHDGFVIRPAADAGEIVLEGKTLHHCVGGDQYLNAHNNGTSLILLLRPVAEKKVPFITVELYDNYKIRQWHGAYNKKILEKDIEAWLETYTTKLKTKTLNQPTEWSGVA